MPPFEDPAFVLTVFLPSAGISIIFAMAGIPRPLVVAFAQTVCCIKIVAIDPDLSYVGFSVDPAVVAFGFPIAGESPGHL